MKATTECSTHHMDHFEEVKELSVRSVCEMKVSLISPVLDKMSIVYLPGFTHEHKHAGEAAER